MSPALKDFLGKALVFGTQSTSEERILLGSQPWGELKLSNTHTINRTAFPHAHNCELSKILQAVPSHLSPSSGVSFIGLLPSL